MKNTEKFTEKAQTYEQYRPSYPQELMEYLYTQVGFSAGSVIADVGAGTGIFSRLLLQRGSRVLCVEPNAEMRSLAQQQLRQYERAEIINAPAERTQLEARSVDFITVAQAFHWFSPQAFACECRRILRPAGKVVLVWNSRVSTDPLTQALKELLHIWRPEFYGFSGGTDTAKSTRDFFQKGTCIHHSFANDLQLTWEQFLGRQLSSSYALSEKDASYPGFVQALKKLFDLYEKNGTVWMRMVTDSYVGEVME